MSWDRIGLRMWMERESWAFHQAGQLPHAWVSLPIFLCLPSMSNSKTRRDSHKCLCYLCRDRCEEEPLEDQESLCHLKKHLRIFMTRWRDTLGFSVCLSPGTPNRRTFRLRVGTPRKGWPSPFLLKKSVEKKTVWKYRREQETAQPTAGRNQAGQTARGVF